MENGSFISNLLSYHSYTRRQEEKDIVVMKIILNLNNNREDSVMFIVNYNYVSNFRHS